MERLRVSLRNELGLENQQVMVERAMFTSDGRADIDINFFGVDGASQPDKDTMLNITHSLKGDAQLPSLSGFKPYILRSVEASDLLLGTSLWLFFPHTDLNKGVCLAWALLYLLSPSRHDLGTELGEYASFIVELDLVVGIVDLFKGTRTILDRGLLLASYWAFSL